MRLFTVHSNTCPCSARCHQPAIDILARPPLEVKRFWLGISHLWQKPPKNLPARQTQHPEPTRINPRVSAWDSPGMSCWWRSRWEPFHSVPLSQAYKGHLKGTAVPRLWPHHPSLQMSQALLTVSGPIYYFPECFPFKTRLCSLYLLVETVQF